MKFCPSNGGFKMAKTVKSAAELREEINSSSCAARGFINALFDEGTFLERGTYVKRGEGYFEGVITGCGSVDGRPVFAFVQDSDNEKGAFTAAHGKKISAIYEAALRGGAPVVAVFSGAGARVTEGVDVLSAYGSVMAAVSEAKGVIPQIAVIDGICSGASAVLSEMFDVVIATEGANRYLTARGEKIGHPHLTTDNAPAKVKELLSFLPLSCDDVAPLNDEDPAINQPIDVSALVDGDVHELISALSDSAPLYLSEEHGKETVTALIRLNGRAVGVAASQPTENGGALTPCAAKKLASFVNFCGEFNLPVVTLVNSVGFKNGCGGLRSFSDLAFAYTSCPSPVVTAVVGKAYGSVFTLLGSKALGADTVFALDTAEVSILNPDTAVEFLSDSELRASSDPVSTRNTLKDEWLSGEASPLNAARSGDIDDIVASDELRQRIASALEFLA